MKVKKNFFSLDAHRRAIEALPPEQYEQQSYYEKWASGMATLCVEKGIFTKAELEEELGISRNEQELEIR